MYFTMGSQLKATHENDFSPELWEANTPVLVVEIVAVTWRVNDVQTESDAIFADHCFE